MSNAKKERRKNLQVSSDFRKDIAVRNRMQIKSNWFDKLKDSQRITTIKCIQFVIIGI